MRNATFPDDGPSITKRTPSNESEVRSISTNRTRSGEESVAPDELLSALRSEAAGYYRNRRRPKYIAGWLKRAYS